jgi:hypothetical protein
LDEKFQALFSFRRNKKAHSPNGKAQDFDSCIYWFESGMGYLSLIGPLAQLVRASGS